MHSDYWQMGYNDFLSCQEHQEMPEHFTVIQWLDYREGVDAAAKGDGDD